MDITSEISKTCFFKKSNISVFFKLINYLINWFAYGGLNLNFQYINFCLPYVTLNGNVTLNANISQQL